MGIFGSIKDAIFGKDDEAQDRPTTRREPAVEDRPAARPANTGNAWADAPEVEPSQPRQAAVIDVENHLDSMPGADRLNWRTSIVDLMKLIGVDSDYDSRRALAQELGRPEYSGTPEDNVWLHRRTMRELSSNGGRVPAEFLD